MHVVKKYVYLHELAKLRIAVAALVKVKVHSREVPDTKKYKF